MTEPLSELMRDITARMTSPPVAPPTPVVEPGRCRHAMPDGNYCRQPGRLYPQGTRCDNHRPGTRPPESRP